MRFKITNGNFSYGANQILYGIDFEIKDGEKIAICGRNGSGKTTLLKLITGENVLDSNIDKKDSNLIKMGINSIGYLKQISFTDETITLEEEILKVFQNLIDTEKEINLLQQKLEKDSSEKLIKEFSNLNQKFIDEGGFTYKKEYNAVLKAFKFTEEDKCKKIGEFSGGQKTKIAFVKLLLSKPDILIFDEPTNHLDIDSIEWLENYLVNYKKCVVIVSHDRDFLDKIVNIVYEVEYGKVKKYVGNYTDFINQKKLNYEQDLKKYKEQQLEIEKQEKLIERFRYKATKASMVQSRIKALDKMDILENPEKANTKTFHFNLDFDDNTGKEVLDCKDLQIGYDKVLATINLKLMRGEKIGIIGKNGCGKSTFLKTLVNKISPLGGEFNFGYKTKIGYFEQQSEKHTSTKTIYEDYTDTFVNLNETQARNDLGSFLFSGEDIYKKLCELSGGEMVRLGLLKIFKTNPNVLILDEPTNHMDIIGKETLEDMLLNYKGTLITVSHDRYFIKKITSSVLVFEEDKVVYYPDGYNEYLQKRQNTIDEDLTKDKKKETKKVEEKVLTKSNIEYLSVKEKARKERQILALEEKINNKESEIKIVEEELNLPEVFENVEKLLSTNKKLELLKQELEELTIKWLELNE